MRVQICAVGRLRKGSERDLYNDYLTRFDRTGRALALGPAQLIEVEDKKGGGMSAEAALLDRAVPDGALICTMSSPLSSSRDFRTAAKSRSLVTVGWAVIAAAPALAGVPAAVERDSSLSSLNHVDRAPTPGMP